jgi:TetR/AcrR family transcriptional regulator, regulator of biofilm formation and stress response
MPYVEASVRSRQFVAAARQVMARDGVAAASLRVVAAEAEVPLGTLQYVFPSKELLLTAVIEDVVDEISRLLRESVEIDRGLAHAIRQGLTTFWTHLVADQVSGQLVQGELLNYSLRKPGQEHLARWQYTRYTSIIAEGCAAAAERAGEVTAVPVERLARVMLAGVDGLIIQYACDPDDERARADLDAMIDMVIAHARIRRPDDV